jgi:outer membrane autotransporter protein
MFRPLNRSHLKSFFLTSTALVAMVPLLSVSAHAQSFTWTGGGSTPSTADSSNWQGGAPPVSDGSADLIFGGATPARTDPRFDAAFSAHSVVIQNNHYTVSGAGLSIGGGGIYNDGRLINFALPLTLSASQTWDMSRPDGPNIEAGRFVVSGPLDLAGHQLTLLGNGTVEGSITGEGSLRLVGRSYGFTSVELTGTNSFKGRIVIEGNGGNAFVRAVDSGALPADADVEINAQGGFALLQLYRSQRIGSLAGDGTVFLGLRSNLAIGTGDGSSAFSGVIQGDSGNPGSSLTKIGTGTLTLSGANTYDGGTTISGGTLSVSSDVNLGAPSGVLTLNGGILQTTADFASARNVSLAAGGGTLQTDANLTLTGTMTGPGGFGKTGAGMLTLSGSNTYAGPTQISNGMLVAQGGSATPDTSAVHVAASTAYRVEGNETIGSLSGAGTVVITNGQTLTTGANDQSASFAGSFSGSGSLEVVGNGTFTLTGTSTLGGDITVCCSSLDVRGEITLGGDAIVSGGSLSVSNRGRLVAGGAAGPIGGSLTVSGGGQLDASAFGTVTGGDFTVIGAGSLARSDAATFMAVLGDARLIVANGGRLETIQDAEIGSGIAATVEGTSSVWTVGQNLFVGSDDVGPGSLTVADGGAVSAGVISLGQDSTLQIGTGGRAGTLSTPILDNAGAVAFNHTDDLSFAGAISGAGTLTKLGSGTLALSGTSTYTGATTVAGGVLAVDGTLASTSTQVQVGATLTGSGSLAGLVTVQDGATLAGTSGQTLDIGSLTLASTATLDVTLSAGSPDPLFDVAGDLALHGRLTIDESSDLSGASSYALLSHGGTLTRSPLTLTSAPIGYKLSNFALNTSAGQVSLTLVDAAGQQYWTQGSGLWSSFGWSNSAGTLLTRWEGDTAVFRGSGGTVTVDGSQSFSALRFEADGYRIVPGSGGALTITGAQGDVRVESGRSATIATPIDGTGRLAKGGTGTLILSGTNTYQGGTWLAAGTLGISSDANLGDTSGGLAITGGATLQALADLNMARPITLGAGGGVLDSDAHTLTLAGSISGTGTLSKLGTGTLTLAGANTYAGGTTITAGTLVGSATSLGSGLITNNAALVINQGADATLANAITGAGRLTKTGAGRLNLTGTSTLSGPTDVQAGNLAVNGSLATSVVTVGPKAILSGTGMVGGLLAQNGATIAPGNSIGTLNVSGNVGFASGSLYRVEINAAGQSDRIAASGAATLSGGTVQILPDQGIGYVADVPYTILTAQGGVAGTFSGTSGGEFAFITPTLGYANTGVTLTLVRKVIPPLPPLPPAPVAFHSVAVTKNQYTTADGAEALGEGHRLYDLILGASVSGARQAFDALSGEVHASTATVAYGDARLVQQSILSHLRQPLSTNLPTVQGSSQAAYAADRLETGLQPVTVAPSFDSGRSALWGEGFASWGKVASNGNAASLDTSTGGFILGADAQLDPSFRIGVAGGFTRTSFDVDARLSSGANGTVFGSLYGSGQWGAINLRLGAAYAHHDIDLTRTVTFPGFADQVTASTNGATLQAFGEVGYRLDGGLVAIEPFAGASVLRLHTGAFQENGGAAALTGLAQDYDLGTTTLGFRAEGQFRPDLPLIVRGLVGWRRAYGDVEPEALLAFAGGASTFMVSGVPVDRDTLVAEAGLDWQIRPDMTLGVTYSGQIGNRAQDHGVKGNFTWRFGTH